MKEQKMKRRNPFVVLLLSIITFGIYDLYWLVKTKGVLNRSTKVHVPTIWLILGPAVLSLLLYFVAFFTLYNNANLSSSGVSSNTSGLSSEAHLMVILPIVSGIFLIFVVITSFYWIFKFSKAINEYTGGKMTTGVTFILLWLVHLIGVALVQDAFNDMTEAGNTTAGPNFPAGPNPPTNSNPTPPAPILQPPYSGSAN